MHIREKILLNLASVDIVEIKAVDDSVESYYIYIATRGGGEKLEVYHTQNETKDSILDSREVLIYEPATGSKETLYDFVEREMLGKYEVQGRTGKVKYKV